MSDKPKTPPTKPPLVRQDSVPTHRPIHGNTERPPRAWAQFRARRMRIEKDEPGTYRALDVAFSVAWAMRDAAEKYIAQQWPLLETK